MKFIDIATIFIKSGDGGKGHISFRREKFVPKGGPDGGNGGKGGDIVFYTDPQIYTLLDFKYQRNFIASNGVAGGKARCSGKDGKTLTIRVPCGTVIKSAMTNEIVADLVESGKNYTILTGGKGGHGNAEFATATNQTPRYAEPGLPGKEMEILLELKSIADIGIVGYPNVGKSTLISVISAAKPKIADYPFTTLTPNLGIVRLAAAKSLTVADIPGIIEGASDGRGLGIRFLRHIERTKVLLFMIDAMSANPKQDYKVLKAELKKYDPSLLLKQKIIVISRIDMAADDVKKKLSRLKFEPKDAAPTFMISSAMREGLEELKWEMWNRLESAHADVLGVELPD